MKIRNLMINGTAALMLASMPLMAQKEPEVRLGYEQRNPKPEARPAYNPQGTSPYSSVSRLPIAQPGGRQNIYGYSYGRAPYAQGQVLWTPQMQAQEPEQMTWEQYIEDAIASDLAAVERKLGRRFFQRNRMDSEGNLHDFIIYETYGLPGSTDATVARVIDVARKGKKVAKGTDDRKMDDAYALYQDHYWGIRGIKYKFVNVSEIKNMEDIDKTRAFVAAFVVPGLNFDFHAEPEIRIKDEGLYKGSRKELRDKKPDQ